MYWVEIVYILNKCLILIVDNMKTSRGRSILIALILIFVLGHLASCDKDDGVMGKSPEIEFLTDLLTIDLNMADNPSITSVVNSEIGLSSVSMYIIKTGNVVEPFKNTINSFFNDKSYSIYEKPVYQEDMLGFKVVAVDKREQVTESVLFFDVKPMLNAPEINFEPEELVIREGDPVPEFYIRVKALTELQSVIINKVVDRLETSLIEPVENFEEPYTFNLHSLEYVDEITFGPGITSIKVQAVDSYGKVKISLFPVTYIELPAPMITFDNTGLLVDEFASGNIEGMIASETGLSRVEFIMVGEDLEELVTLDGKELPEHPKQYEFNVAYEKVTVDVKGVLVRAYDLLGKKTETVLPVTVNEIYPAPSVSCIPEDFNAIDMGASIQYSGMVVSTAGLASLQVEKINTKGESTLVRKYDVTGTLGESVEISGEVEAMADLVALRVYAVDLNGKITTHLIRGTVGYYLLENVEVGAEKYPFDVPGCFFSTSLRQILTIDKAYGIQDKIDFCFYVTGSPAGIIRVCSMAHGDAKSKYTNKVLGGVNYGVDIWGVRNKTLVQASDFIPDNFDAYTIEDMKSKDGVYTGTRGDLTLSNDAESLGTGAHKIVWFKTVTADGTTKRGLIKYEGISPNSVSKVRSSDCKFNISIKIEK